MFFHFFLTELRLLKKERTFKQTKRNIREYLTLSQQNGFSNDILVACNSNTCKITKVNECFYFVGSHFLQFINDFGLDMNTQIKKKIVLTNSVTGY